MDRWKFSSKTHKSYYLTTTLRVLFVEVPLRLLGITVSMDLSSPSPKLPRLLLNFGEHSNWKNCRRKLMLFPLHNIFTPNPQEIFLNPKKIYVHLQGSISGQITYPEINVLIVQHCGQQKS